MAPTHRPHVLHRAATWTIQHFTRLWISACTMLPMTTAPVTTAFFTWLSATGFSDLSSTNSGSRPAGRETDGRQAVTLAAGGDRETVRSQSGVCPSAERADFTHAVRRTDLPDRPLPRQGDSPKHHGAALRQRHVRADLEPRSDRSRADHRGRDGGRGAARPVLRTDRRAARHGAEPRVSASRDGRDGAPHRLRRTHGARPQGGRVRRDAGSRRG